MIPRDIIEAFDAWLEPRSLRLEAIVVGGAALSLLGVISRQTRDVDILHPELPREVTEAAKAFASGGAEAELDLNWLNNGPTQLADVLPDDWRGRVRVVFEGKAIKLSTLGRADLLKSKLFGLCD